jgi:hypothetical protein
MNLLVCETSQLGRPRRRFPLPIPLADRLLAQLPPPLKRHPMAASSFILNPRSP